MQCPWKALFDVTFGSILIVNFLSSNPHQFFIIIEFAVDLEIMLEVTCIKRIIFFQTIWLFRPYGLFVHDLLVLNLTRRLNSLEDIPLSFLLSVSKCMIILDIDVFCKFFKNVEMKHFSIFIIYSYKIKYLLKFNR